MTWIKVEITSKCMISHKPFWLLLTKRAYIVRCFMVSLYVYALLSLPRVHFAWRFVGTEGVTRQANLSLFITCDCLLPVIAYYLWLCITCDCLLPVIVYYLWLFITCDCLLPVIVYYLWLFITCDCLLPVIVYYLWLFITCDCLLPVIVYYLWSYTSLTKVRSFPMLAHDNVNCSDDHQTI